ncbi:MAG: M48 family metallopeptidase [Gammaproteobacteria bacterium]|nr:M48 family metallopeptidase [Gammaproteobacteria bacterium]
MIVENFASIFVCAVLLKTALLCWLSVRQARAAAVAPQAPPDAFSVSFSDKEKLKAAEYSGARQRLSRCSMVTGAAMTLLWTIGGGLAWLDALVREWTTTAAGSLATEAGVGAGAGASDLADVAGVGGLVPALVTIGAFFIIGAIVSLPFSVYSTFVIEERFGFNRTRPALYVADLLKSLCLSAVLGAVLLGVILWLMDAMRATAWWLWAWGFIVAWNLFLIAVWPRWLAPIFNRFTLLSDGELRSRIRSLLERCGFSAGAVYVMDGSRRSAHGNAYFTGFGRHKRVVFFDTLLDTLSPQQTEAVLAHELGHSALKHIPKTLALTIAMWLPALWLLDQLLYAPWFFAAFGLAPANHLALLLFALVLPAFVFVIRPLMAYLSRKHEFEADAYAAAHSDGSSLITALVQLYKDNAVALTPDPWYSAWHDSHPPPVQRIKRLNAIPASDASNKPATIPEP